MSKSYLILYFKLIIFFLDKKMFTCFLINCGSRYEKNKIGLAKFIEHLKFHETNLIKQQTILPSKCNICHNSKKFFTYKSIKQHFSTHFKSNQYDKSQNTLECLNLEKNNLQISFNTEKNFFSKELSLLKHQFENHLIDMYSLPNIPQNLISYIIKFNTELHKNFLDIIRNNELKTTDFEQILNFYDNYSTNYKQINSIKTSKFFIDSLELRFGSREEVSGRTESIIKVDDTFNYIRISDTLKNILECEAIRNEIENYVDDTDFVPSHYNNEFWRNKNTLRVVLYYDELEIKNPLGIFY